MSNARRELNFQGKRIKVFKGVVVIQIEGEWKIILPECLWSTVCKISHGSIWAGHLQSRKTWKRISSKYWNIGLREFVYAWCASCRDCGSRKQRGKQVIPPLRPQGVDEVGDRWAIDVSGPFKACKGFEYAVVMIEYVTRFAVVIPVKNRREDVIAQAILDSVFCFGPMRELLSDSAGELAGKVASALCEVIQAKQIHPVPYRPNFNGLVERFTRTLKDMLSIYVDENQDDWADWISPIVYAYNSAVQDSVKFSPFELMFGRKAKDPQDLLLPLTTARSNGSNWPEWVKKLKSKMTLARKAAKKSLKVSQEIQRKMYNRKACERFKVVPGKWVWIYFPKAAKGIGKLRHRWRGPFEILQGVGHDNFECLDLEKQKRVIAHVSFMAKFDDGNELMEKQARALAEVFGQDLEIDDDGDEPLPIQKRRVVRNRSGMYEHQVRVRGDWYDLATFEKESIMAKA